MVHIYKYTKFVNARIQTNHIRVLVCVYKYVTCWDEGQGWTRNSKWSVAGCPSALYMSVSARIQTNHIRVLVRVNKYMTCFVYECECTYTNKSHTCISVCIQICDVLGRGADMDTKLQVKCGGMSECFVYERERTYTNNQEVCMWFKEVHVYKICHCLYTHICSHIRVICIYVILHVYKPIIFVYMCIESRIQTPGSLYMI
jgi:hypothetical protein